MFSYFSAASNATALALTSALALINTFHYTLRLLVDLNPSSLATLPVDLRIRAPQWRYREIELQWREEDEAGVEVVRRRTSLSGPSMDVLAAHLCEFTELVSNSQGIMPRLRVATVST